MVNKMQYCLNFSRENKKGNLFLFIVIFLELRLRVVTIEIQKCSFTLSILIDSSFWFDKLGIVHCTYLWMSSYNLKNIFFTFTISVDSDEMLHDMAFHLGLHCL